ncbi:MAG: HU family DNA-binding protein, partial [Bacillota bacterium]|nr:HU family DNA-binding protein [Bacillota bacterium]
MNKRELVTKVAQESSIPNRKAKEVVNLILELIQNALVAEDKVRVLGFGSFETKKRAARKGRNPQTGEVIQMSSTTVPVFKPGKGLKEAVNSAEEMAKNDVADEAAVKGEAESVKPKIKSRPGLPKIIAVTSGKGGAGKTNFVINSAISMAQAGLRTYVIDADLGTANVDVLLGIRSKFTIEHLVNNTLTSVMDVVVEGPAGIKIIPGGSGIQSLTELSHQELNRVIDMFEPLEEHADVIFIDTGSGISKSVVNFLMPADEIVIVITSEPHSITDAYALIKVLNDHQVQTPMKLVFNMVDDLEEAKSVARKML